MEEDGDEAFGTNVETDLLLLPPLVEGEGEGAANKGDDEEKTTGS